MLPIGYTVGMDNQFTTETTREDDMATTDERFGRAGHKTCERCKRTLHATYCVKAYSGVIPVVSHMYCLTCWHRWPESAPTVRPNTVNGIPTPTTED
jgi:hypothetical protein